MALRWQGRPCDPGRDTPRAHSRFGTAWGSPIGQSGGGLHFHNQVNLEVVQDLGDGEEECDESVEGVVQSFISVQPWVSVS